MPVASYTEAWIETFGLGGDCIQVFVASYTEAWIETLSYGNRPCLDRVASYTEAWIETSSAPRPQRSPWSPPTRRRGLKLPASYTQPHGYGRLLHGGVD